MPSFGVEKNLTSEIIRLIGGGADDMFPGLIVGQKHTVIFSPPALAAVCPVSPDKVQNFPQRHHLIRFGDRLPGILV